MATETVNLNAQLPAVLRDDKGNFYRPTGILGMSNFNEPIWTGQDVSPCNHVVAQYGVHLRRVLDYTADCGKAWREFTPDQQAEVRRLQTVQGKTWCFQTTKSWFDFQCLFQTDARYWPLDPAHPDTPPAWRPADSSASVPPAPQEPHCVKECPKCGRSSPPHFQYYIDCAPRLVVVDRGLAVGAAPTPPAPAPVLIVPVVVLKPGTFCSDLKWHIREGQLAIGLEPPPVMRRVEINGIWYRLAGWQWDGGDDKNIVLSKSPWSEQRKWATHSRWVLAEGGAK